MKKPFKNDGDDHDVDNNNKQSALSFAIRQGQL
jgi:hypothetical protein